MTRSPDEAQAPGRDVVVVGASAGGVEALVALVAGLPPDFPGSIFVVLHVPADSRSVLAGILDRAGPLAARAPADGEAIAPGTVYVAPNDHHLLVEPGVVRIKRGPRENGHRPAVDPLFRSAAVAYGRRVVAVILSGTLDDGTAGMQVVKARGGAALVQDPSDALYPGMAESALRHVRVDEALPLAEIPARLDAIVREPIPAADREAAGVVAGAGGPAEDVEIAGAPPGEPTGYTCPDCGGAVWELHEGELVQYRCHVGHRFSPESFVAAQNEDVEEALWEAHRLLRERAGISRRMGRRLEGGGSPRSARRFYDEAVLADQQAVVLRGLLEAQRVAPVAEAGEQVAQ